MKILQKLKVKKQFADIYAKYVCVLLLNYKLTGNNTKLQFKHINNIDNTDEIQDKLKTFNLMIQRQLVAMSYNPYFWTFLKNELNVFYQGLLRKDSIRMLEIDSKRIQTFLNIYYGPKPDWYACSTTIGFLWTHLLSLHKNNWSKFFFS